MNITNMLYKKARSLLDLFSLTIFTMSTPIPSGGFKFYQLSKNLERAIDAAKDILKNDLHMAHLQAKISVRIGDVQYETPLIYLRKENPQKVDQLKDEVVAKFPDVDFDEVLLLVGKLTSRVVKCPNCDKEMQSNHLTRHLKSCVKDQYCPMCQKEVEGDLKEHIEMCCRKRYSCNICGESFNTGARRTTHQKKCQRKTYDCNICGESFSTGAMRTRHQKERHKKTYDCNICGESFSTGAMRTRHQKERHKKTYDCRICGEPFNTASQRATHEKTCRVADARTLPQISKDGAIDGLFRIVRIEPKNKTPDYYGIMEDESDHIVDILNNTMVTALKFYISIELNMSQLLEGISKIVTFQTRSTILLKAMDPEAEVREHIDLLDSKVDKYINNGSGWLVDNVRVINVMMTKYNSLS
ncbi:MAG: hypothetical protein GY820_04960 [Gammaproteobacteria bacterium]|nr:hypothetical protein [Gammaproteobacteria bacterium]